MSSTESHLFLPRDPANDTPEQAELRREIRAEAQRPVDFSKEYTMLDLAIEAGRKRRQAADKAAIKQEDTPDTDPPTNHPEGEHHD